jgi:hypothetical protein
VIKFSLSIGNPFVGRRVGPRWSWSRSCRVSLNKYLEAQADAGDLSTLFEIYIDTNLQGCDHASVMLSLQVPWLYVHLQLYDRRHWDYENWKWEDD